MTDPLEPILERINRARQVLGLYRPSPIVDVTDAVVVQILTDLRHLVDDDATNQRLLDASRLAWYRDVLAADPGHLVNEGVPRSRVWRRHLGTERMVGDFWRAWPERVKADVVDACIDAEAEAVDARLAAIAADTGVRASWNPLTGLFERAPRPLEEEAPSPSKEGVFDRAARHRILGDAFGSVLDRYRDLEDEQVAEFIVDVTEQLEERGYEVDVYLHDGREGGEPETNYTLAHPYHRQVELNLLEHNPNPLPADAQALADFADLAEHLPPLEVDPADISSWYHRDFTPQAHAAGGGALEGEDYVRLLAALADARTEAVNAVLIDTGYVWDPRIGLARPIPNEVPRPLTREQHAEVEAAKTAVDPLAVYRATFGELPDPVAAAYPAEAATTGTDTDPATEPGFPTSTPRPGL
jgi:hypothetical protein